MCTVVIPPHTPVWCHQTVLHVTRGRTLPTVFVSLASEERLKVCSHIMNNENMFHTETSICVQKQHTANFKNTQYTVPQKTSYLWLAITFHNFDTCVCILIFLTELLPIKYVIKRCYTMPPQITCASALPGTTGNMKIAFFTQMLH